MTPEEERRELQRLGFLDPDPEPEKAPVELRPSTRMLIIGGPLTGKTTMAKAIGERFNIPVKHTDDLIKTHEWSEASQEVSTWLDKPGPWIIEGTAGARALRKWLDRNPEGVPCNAVHLLTKPHQELTSGQEALSKGCATVWEGIADQVAARGVQIIQ